MVRKWASQGKIHKGMENLSQKGNDRYRALEVKKIMILGGNFR